jgi:predicted DCC family thiol-disulfide oxidoreductase YuxK
MRFLRMDSEQSYLRHLASRLRRKRIQERALNEVTHRRYIEAISEETKLSISHVVPLYAKVVAGLESTAEITTYVPIFAWRRVKDILKHQKVNKWVE